MCSPKKYGGQAEHADVTSLLACGYIVAVATGYRLRVTGFAPVILFYALSRKKRHSRIAVALVLTINPLTLNLSMPQALTHYFVDYWKSCNFAAAKELSILNI